MNDNQERMRKALEKEISDKLITQLLRWDRGETSELFSKNLFEDPKQADTVRKAVFGLRDGNHITEKPFHVIVGRKAYRKTFPWVESAELPKGFMVYAVPADKGSLRDTVDFPIHPQAGHAVERLQGMLSELIEYARMGAPSTKTRMKTLRKLEDSTILTAATAEDFVNGMNVLLDRDLQINPELARGVRA